MSNLVRDLEVGLTELRRLTSADFAALAWQDHDSIIRWKCASGNRSNRYKRILLRFERGIAGSVIRTVRPVMINNFSPEIKENACEYPILLAEDLKSAIGVPVKINEQVMGVLLVGCRVNREFDRDTVELIGSVAEQLGSMLQQNDPIIKVVFNGGLRD
ncbi:MAG TPA: GAF domain-containing protein [Bacillota bacterium]|nr:GAF domain-containing protein [Bacillota bacterium]